MKGLRYNIRGFGEGLVKRPVFYRMLFSYLLAFLLPLIVAMVSSMFLNSQYRSLELQSQNDAVRQARSMLDANLSTIESIGSLLFSDESVKTLMNHREPLSTASLIECWRLRVKLDRYRATNSLIDDIYVHFQLSDAMMSTSGLYREGSFSPQCEDKVGASYDDFLALTAFSGNCQYVVLGSSETNTSSRLVVACNYYGDDKHLNQASIFFTIRTDAFLSSLGIENASPFLYDTRTGQAVLLSRDAALSDQVTTGLERLDEPFVETKDALLFHARSTKAGELLCCSLLPRDFFDAYVKQRSLFIYGLWLICLLLGITAVIRGTRAQYSPIDNLMRSLRKHIQQNPLPGSNEYDVIDDSIRQLVTLTHDSQQKLTEKNDLLHDYVLERIFKNRYRSEEDIFRISVQYDLQLNGDAHIALIISLDDCPALTSEQDAQEDLTAQQTLYSLIGTALRKTLETPNCQIESCVISEYLCCVLSTAETSAGAEHLRPLLSKLSASLSEELSIRISIGAGKVVHSLQHIANSYCSAQKAMSYLQFSGFDNQLLFAEDVDDCAGQCHIDWQKDLELQKKFLNYMLQGEYQKAGAAIAKMLPDNLNGSEESMALWQNRRYFVTAIVKDSFQRQPAFRALSGSLDSLSSAVSAREFTNALEALFAQAVDVCAETKTLEERLNERVLSIVQKNYSSPNISVAQIAEECGVSISCVSRSFKNHVGVGLLDYIHMMRIQSAKELFQSTNLTVKEIADRMGYLSPLTMSRAFQRYEGITPSGYRELCRKA